MAIRRRLGQPRSNRVPVDNGHCRQDGGPIALRSLAPRDTHSTDGETPPDRSTRWVSRCSSAGDIASPQNSRPSSRSVGLRPGSVLKQAPGSSSPDPNSLTNPPGGETLAHLKSSRSAGNQKTLAAAPSVPSTRASADNSTSTQFAKLRGYRTPNLAEPSSSVVTVPGVTTATLPGIKVPVSVMSLATVITPVRSKSSLAHSIWR